MIPLTGIARQVVHALFGVYARRRGGRSSRPEACAARRDRSALAGKCQGSTAAGAYKELSLAVIPHDSRNRADGCGLSLGVLVD